MQHALRRGVHPIRAHRDANVQACLRFSNGSFNQAAAEAWVGLSKDQRREKAA